MTDLLGKLYERKTRLVTVHADGTASLDPPGEVVVLAGSFNPLHRGHEELLAAAEQVTGRRGVFEISIENVDKPDLPRAELEQRLAQFRGKHDVAATCTRLFTEKSDVMPRAWFVLGFDTAKRLLEDRYYPDDGNGRGSAARVLARLAERGVRFVVAGREDKDGQFHEADELDVPQELEGMFELIPSDQFRMDISSTELRQRPGRR